MLFNSFEFIFVFLPIIFILYFGLAKLRLIKLATAVLTIASIVFYGYWNFIYVPLIVASFTFNFFIGQRLCEQVKNSQKKHKSLLAFGIISNIALLCYYKYTDFFIENFNGIFGADVPLMHIVLPLGISFFTFTQIAFLVDCWRGFVREKSFINYALFVTYFPHLLAGPIIHHAEMMPQFANLRRKKIHYKNISIGIFLFSMGLFKKVCVADFFAHFANYGFDSASNLSLLDAWVSSLSYTFELYFDFSGYTDMAIGISYMFNIVLPLNFNSPYKATNIGDFWHRWHMTLSRFLRDYIYIPLGGNRVGEARLYVNLFLVFLIGGIWHGAGWTFVIWGCMHGIGIVIARFYSLHFGKMNKILAWFITFNFVNIAWIFFRANDINSAFKVLGAMFSLENGFSLSTDFIAKINDSLSILVYFINNKLVSASGVYNFIWVHSFIFALFFIIFLAVLLAKNSQELVLKAGFSKKTMLWLWIMLALVFLSSRDAGVSAFLYFNF